MDAETTLLIAKLTTKAALCRIMCDNWLRCKAFFVAQVAEKTFSR